MRYLDTLIIPIGLITIIIKPRFRIQAHSIPRSSKPHLLEIALAAGLEALVIAMPEPLLVRAYQGISYA